VKNQPTLTCHLLDLRNHGNSPHSENMNYDLLVKDVIKFIEDNNLLHVSILGHSYFIREEE